MTHHRWTSLEIIRRMSHHVVEIIVFSKPHQMSPKQQPLLPQRRYRRQLLLQLPLQLRLRLRLQHQPLQLLLQERLQQPVQLQQQQQLLLHRHQDHQLQRLQHQQ